MFGNSEKSGPPLKTDPADVNHEIPRSRYGEQNALVFCQSLGHPESSPGD